MADHFASSVVSTRKTRRHLPPSCSSVSRLKELGPIISVEMPNGTGNFQKKGRRREVNQNFLHEFPENFCSIRFFWSDGTRPSSPEAALLLVAILGADQKERGL